MSDAATRHRARAVLAPTSTTPAVVPVEIRALSALKLHPRTLRRHPEQQVAQLADGIRQFGFLCPLVVDEQGFILAGHARHAAALQAGLSEVPVVLAGHLSAAQKRAFRLADNKLAELADWDAEVLKLELTDLSVLDLDFSVELTGFSTAEIDVILDGTSDDSAEESEELPPPRPRAVSQPGDLWRLGKHVLYCGDAREPASYARLLGDRRAHLIVTDAPYNVRVDGHVSGRGRIKHREFAMASGEMSKAEFTEFLTTVFRHLAVHSVDGALQYLFMDHRHVEEMLAAGAQAYDERLNILVWKKTNAGLGSMYRSQHELIFVYKHGQAPHVNNVRLGANGRYRTNVLEYPGANTFRSGRDEELTRHPTPKTVGLIADLIRDASRTGDLVLDCFAGGGTIFIAAEKTRRHAAAIEIDPLYCDLSIERWQLHTSEKAVLSETGESFDAMALSRGTSEPAPLAAEAGHG